MVEPLPHNQTIPTSIPIPVDHTLSDLLYIAALDQRVATLGLSGPHLDMLRLQTTSTIQSHISLAVLVMLDVFIWGHISVLVVPAPGRAAHAVIMEVAIATLLLTVILMTIGHLKMVCTPAIFLMRMG